MCVALSALEWLLPHLVSCRQLAYLENILPPRQVWVTKELKGLWRIVFKTPKTFLGNLVRKDPDNFKSILSKTC